MNPLLFAIIKHDSQRRKGINTPYVVHPIQAYTILVDLDYEVNVATATLLHDILEDTDTTPETLTYMFGKEVTELVKSVSKNYSGEFDFTNAPIDSLIVKTADTLANVQDFINFRTGVSEAKLEKYIKNLIIASERLKKTAEQKNISLGEYIDSSIRNFISRDGNKIEIKKEELKERPLDYENNPDFPNVIKIGDIIYLETELHLSHGFDDMIGGKARVESVEENNELGPLVGFEGIRDSYYLKDFASSHFYQIQATLKDAFGHQWARWEPDFRTEFNDDF